MSGFAGVAQPVLRKGQLPDIHAESGNFYLRIYTPKEYGSSFQNWSVLQNKYGSMFFANGDGVLSYDGKTWAVIETPTESVVRSIGIDSSGKIFVGALDDLGYLEQRKNGKLVYVSLLNLIKPDLHGMGNIWSIHVHRESVYFEAETGVFCLSNGQFKFSPWPNPQAFHKSFFWSDHFYASEEGTGLLQLRGDTFTVLPEGIPLKNVRIYTAMPLAGNRLLLGTRHDGLFEYNGRRIIPFKTNADRYLKSEKIYSGLITTDSMILIGTRTGGMVMLEQNGKIRNMITKENGLSSNTVWGMTFDRSGDLWLALDDGLARVELNTPVMTYANKPGFEGASNDISRHNGRLYVGTNLGVYILRPASFPEHQSHFEKIPGINTVCWDFLQTNNRLLAATNQGVFEIDGVKLRRITENASSFLHQYKGDSSRILIATDNRSLQSLRLEKGVWRDAGFIADVKADNVKFHETKTGEIWIGTFSQGAFLISFLQPDGSVNYDKPKVTHYDSKDGLKEGYIKINTIDNDVLFRVGSDAEIFRFDHTTRRFYQDTLFRKKYDSKDEKIFPITNEDESGRFWAKTRRKTDGSQHSYIITQGASGIPDIKRIDISRITETVGLVTYPEANGTVWYAASGGIVRQQFEKTKEQVPFQTYINKVILLNDSVLFEGIGLPAKQIKFPYTSNSLRFEFTSGNFVLGESNKFQYKLDGYDASWSEWTTENIKEYSRIWEGTYVFLVRSRSYNGVMSQEAAFSFIIAPPWYRTIYAYVFYFLCASFLVWMLVRWRSYQLRQEREELKKVITRRTLEITTQNAQLAEQSEELRVNAERLKELDTLKSNFFVNISHEFRTPLSLILSPLEKSLQENNSQFRHEEIERMHRNARRLQQLINQLLDLARLESGGMRVNVQKTDLIYFLRVLTASFESLAEIRNIRYEVVIPTGSYQALLDVEKVETVLYNLLSNAFKFTPDGGRIDFRAQHADDKLALVISDTGHGIPTEELPKIFDRFYQVDSSSSREYEGSGIGLSLVKELVQLLNGTIRVDSTINFGTTFTVSLPLEIKPLAADDPEHYKEDANPGNASTIESGHHIENALSQEESPVSDSLILLIEDNTDLRAYLRESLEKDYQIVVAENGQLGWEKALDLTPDLIISDMMMPVMDGFTLCTKIRADPRTSHIPFILLTARTSIESKLEGLELGADEYMTKPFNVREIQVRVRNLLDQRQTLRQSFSRSLTLQPANISVTSVDERFLNSALDIMKAHLADDQFSVEKFAEEIGMSRKNLLRKIKALTGESVNEFIRNYRLKHAAQLLEGKAGTVSEIAYQVGFNNLSYFSKCFKELFKVLPAGYSSQNTPLE